MRCLMATGLRAKLGRSQKPEFLEYAATLWSSHLILSPIDCERVFQVMKKFFTGHWVLTWIYALAANNQLRVLIQASKNLSKYTTKRKYMILHAVNAPPWGKNFWKAGLWIF
jgi:hypothetical protein